MRIDLPSRSRGQIQGASGGYSFRSISYGRGKLDPSGKELRLEISRRAGYGGENLTCGSGCERPSGSSGVSEFRRESGAPALPWAELWAGRKEARVVFLRDHPLRLFLCFSVLRMAAPAFSAL